MKNIHILPTDKPSRLVLDDTTQHLMLINKGEALWGNQNIYITSDEKIKEGDWLIVNDEDVMQMKSSYDNDMSGEDIWVGDSLNGYATYKDNCKKIILTTDQDLIKDGVQLIDDEFLEWFVKNPSCEEVKLDSICKCTSCGSSVKSSCDYAYKCNPQIFYKIIIPIEEPKQEIDLTNLCYYDKRNPDCSVDDEDIEDHKKSLLKKNKTCSCDNCFYGRTELTEQLIWQQEKMYSEEEVLKLLRKAHFVEQNIDEWFETYKK